ncbi:UNVERIFIED_CONTAM: hypothetical protein K2H54_041164 [Gekko kuhli]
MDVNLALKLFEMCSVGMFLRYKCVTKSSLWSYCCVLSHEVLWEHGTHAAQLGRKRKSRVTGSDRPLKSTAKDGSVSSERKLYEWHTRQEGTGLDSWQTPTCIENKNGQTFNASNGLFKKNQ